ncbi:MAG: sigma-70 family RNA polymerase sigma factor [Bacteroidetes bacterium]|nr:sigma-70 family RNA polymerase sigma factor [Bacteroidota bacterium]
MQPLTDTDSHILQSIRSGDTAALEALYVQAIPIVTREMGGQRRAHKWLQDALIRLRTDVRNGRLKREPNENLVEYLARRVRERWEQYQQEKELDARIIECLQSETDNGWAFYYMQRYYFPSISYYIRSNGGTEEDAKDIIMDSIYALLYNIREGKYVAQDTTKLKTYFYSICKNKWKDYAKKRKNNMIVSLLDGFEPEDDDAHYYVAYEDDVLNERQKVVAEVFQQATERCHRILSYFYYDNLSHTEIAEKMGYQNADTSKEQKKRCMGKLRLALLKRLGGNPDMDE